jgi:hypothetical protein
MATIATARSLRSAHYNNATDSPSAMLQKCLRNLSQPAARGMPAAHAMKHECGNSNSL